MNEDEILVSSVPRSLDLKSKLFGFEIPDLLLIFLNMAGMNFVFGTTSLHYWMVWGTTIILACVLFFVKRGKPDNYLRHLGEFYSRPAYFTASGRDRLYRRFRKDFSNDEKVSRSGSM